MDFGFSGQKISVLKGKGRTFFFFFYFFLSSSPPPTTNKTSGGNTPLVAFYSFCRV
jgi:hypothetical protein